MPLFGKTKKRITSREFAEMRTSLYSKGFEKVDLDKVSMMLRADLHEPEETQAGIDQGELDRAIAWMEDNMYVHNLSEDKINILKEVLQKGI